MSEANEKKSEISITIGDMARKLDVTVRTLQYYDKEGLVKPSATTAGGRRFYTQHDMVKLHQILSMKYLGFSLEDIKMHLARLNEPQDVVKALELQKNLLKDQISRLEQALADTEILQQEVQQMKIVDFDRYAKIIAMLRKKSESYWLYKLFNERISSHVSKHFFDNLDVWADLYRRWEQACDRTVLLDKKKVDPISKEAQTLAAEWWEITMIFTDGDLSLMPELVKFEEDKSGWSESMRKKIPLAQGYRHRIMEVYLKKEGICL